jgi:hypothetical protein
MLDFARFHHRLDTLSWRSTMRHLPLRFALIMLASTLTGCLLALVKLPVGARAHTPEAKYVQWWEQVEACSGRSARFDRVNWFVVPGAQSFAYRGRTVEAYWLSYRHQIILGESSVDDGRLVRHEMLHDILDTGDHPREYFATRCGRLVRRPRQFD